MSEFEKLKEERMSEFEKLKEELPSKEKFYSSLTGKRNRDKEYELILKVWEKLKWKRSKFITICI